MNQKTLFPNEAKESTYYNTDHERGEELKESKAKVLSQEEYILICFRYCRSEFSPSQCARHLKDCGDKDWPITSIRRAMTNLTIKGKLVKTDKQVKGPYGKREHLWKSTEVNI